MNPLAVTRTLTATLLAVLIAVVAACASEPGRPSSPASIDPNAIRISADGLAFSTDHLSAPADEPFQIAFDNQERPLHNVAIYRDASASDRIFGKEPFSGPAVQTYDVPALETGTYFFRCDVHPEMTGELVVE
jgi:plastocyanin